MKYAVWALLSIFALTGCGGNVAPLSKQGVMDLRDYDLNTAPPVKISGEWLFAWKTFAGNDQLHHFTTVPDKWNGFGYATYGIKILLPDSGKQWAILAPPIHSAYRLYIDNQLLLTAGKPGTDAGMEPHVASHIVYFHAKGNSLFLRLEISNYHFMRGGMWAPLQLGTPAAVTSVRTKAFIFSAFIFGSLLLMGLYHLGLFIFRPADKSPMYLAVVCICFALRECFSLYPLLFYFFPGFPYHAGLKLLYSLFPLSQATLLLFLKSAGLVPFGKYSTRLTIGCCLAYFLLVWLSPNYIYGNALLVLFLINCINGVYAIITTIKGAIARNREQLFMLAGITVCLGCLVNDVLFDAGYTNTSFLLPLGFVFFILCQSFILAMRFARNYRQTGLLAEELAASSKAYEQIAMKRNDIEAAEAIAALKNRFLVNITHEFRTPLSLIMAPAEHLLYKSSASPEQREEILTIYKNARHLVRLMHQLLDLSKLDAGKMEKTEQLGNPREFIEDIVATFNILAKQKGIHLAFEYDNGNDRYCLFDVDKLEKILYNLLSNAIKFTGRDGAVRVKLDYPDNRLRLEITDTGVGMPEETLTQLFQPYYQAPDSGVRYAEGTGIGLSLVKEFVTLLNGTLQVNSQPGEGSRFSVLLPVTFLDGAVPYELSAPVPLLETTPDAHKPSLVIIEDNKALAAYLYKILQPYYEIKTAGTGDEGWEMVQAELPDLVLCDLLLPGKDGYEIASLIRRTAATNHIGLIILSGQADISSKMQGLDLGANDYITKPFHLPELILRVANQVKYQQTLRQYYFQQLTTPGKNDEEDQPHPFLQQIYTILDEYLDDTAFSVPILADKLAMSTRTLNRKLNAMTRMPANELIRNYRLKKAAGLLCKGVGIAEAAYMTGFESPSYFGQCFKDAFQLTPSEYIRQNLKFEV